MSIGGFLPRRPIDVRWGLESSLVVDSARGTIDMTSLGAPCFRLRQVVA